MKLSIPHRFTAGDARSVKAKKNIAISFVFKAGSILINLALVPMTISYVNASMNGIWITLISVITWFNLFDIGFGYGLQNKFAEAVTKGETSLAKTYLSTTYAILAMVILGLWFIFFTVNHYLNWTTLLNVDPSLEGQLSKIVLIIFTFFSFQFVLRLLGTVFTANQEPSKVAVFGFLSNLFVFLSIFILLKTQKEGTLLSLAWITGGYQLLVYLIASIWYYTHDLKAFCPSFKNINFSYVRPLMGLGLKFFVIQIAAIFVFESTNIIITRLLGPDQVTVYNAAYRYFSIPMSIAIIIASPLWPAFTDAYVKGDYKWMKHVHKQFLKLSVIIAFVLIFFFAFSSFAYKIWLGNKVIIPTNISLLMMLNLMASTVFSTLIVMINGVGKIKLQLIVYTILGLLFVPIAYLSGQKFGLVGIITINVVVNVIFAIFAILQSKRIVENKTNGIWNK